MTANSDGTNLPSQYAPWTAFKTIDLTRGTTQAGVNVTECLDDIEKYGFHLTDAHVRITERAVQKSSRPCGNGGALKIAGGAAGI